MKKKWLEKILHHSFRLKQIFLPFLMSVNILLLMLRWVTSLVPIKMSLVRTGITLWDKSTLWSLYGTQRLSGNISFVTKGMRLWLRLSFYIKKSYHQQSPSRWKVASNSLHLELKDNLQRVHVFYSEEFPADCVTNPSFGEPPNLKVFGDELKKKCNNTNTDVLTGKSSRWYKS